MNTEQSSLALRYRKLVARLRDIVQCVICLEIVGCPAVQCEAGHLMCGQCRDNLEENTCPTCRQPLIAVRNLAVEQVVEVLPVECPNADYGCQELLDADEMDTHRVTCPRRQFSCSHPPCSWVGYKPEIIGHMRNTHQQQILSSNKQTVKVPVKWGEVSSWAMFMDDTILVLKFSVDRANNFLLGSFECLGQLKPVDSIIYHMTVKRGEQEMTVSGSIAPERSTKDGQTVEEWDNVFPRSRYEEQPESESSTSSRCIKVDVSVEDNRIPVTQASVDVEVQTQASDDVEVGVRDEAGGDTTQQVGGGKQLGQTADRVIQKLGSWLASGFYDFDDDCLEMSIIHRVITETKTNIISCLIKSVNDISQMRYDNYSDIVIQHCIEKYLYCLSRELGETKIKMERVRAAGASHFKHKWVFPYLLIVELVVYQVFARYVDKFLSIDHVELEKLLTATERRMRDESVQRMLKCAHLTCSKTGLERLINDMGHTYKIPSYEIYRLKREAHTVRWKDITPFF